MAIDRPYTAQTWATGDVITKDKLKNIEDAIAAIDSEVTGARGYGASSGTLGKRIDDLVMIQDTQPTSANNEIWVRSTGNEVQVPTYEEFQNLENSVGEAYSSNKTYEVGDYVIYENKLYRCTTAITTPEAWNASHWTVAPVGDELVAMKATTAAAQTSADNAQADVDDLKSAINPLHGETKLSLVPNSYWPATGAKAGIPTAYANWSCTNRIACVPGEVLKITATVASNYNVFFNSDTDGDVNMSFALAVGENIVTVPAGAYYFGLSNTTAGMNATEVIKIISSADVKQAETNAANALSVALQSANDIDIVEQYVGLAPDTYAYTVISLDYASSSQRRTSQQNSANGIKSVTVGAVSGFLHNINYYKTTPSDADAASEGGWQSGETTFAKPDGYNYWYVRFKKSDSTDFTTSDETTLIAGLSITLRAETIDVPKQVVYVATTGSDSNDGTKAAPYATLQKAVDSGALIVKAGAGNYTGFTVSNRESPLTVMLDSMPAYSTSNPEVPKIKITTAVSGGYGIYAASCSEINLFDIWVDGVSADCMWLQDIGNVNCTRCFVSNNSADNSMGFRLISVNGVFRDCKAWNIVKDGFNIHRYGNTQFINCVAYDCGDDGISHHDGCTGLISGGEYYRCYKGGISSPYGGAKIDIENVYIHDCTQYGIYSMSTSEMFKSAGRISNCVIKNNGTYDIIASYTDLIGWNNIYDTKSIGAQATFTEF